MGITNLDDIRLTVAERTVLDLVAEAQLRDGEPPTVDAIVLMQPHEVAHRVRNALAVLIRDDILSAGSRAGGKEDVRLTPTGLLVCQYGDTASSIAESLLAYYKQRLQKDKGDFHGFTWEDLKSAFVATDDVTFPRVLVVMRTLRLANERTVMHSTPVAIWDLPNDIVDFRGLSDVRDLYRRAEQQRLRVASAADTSLTTNTMLNTRFGGNSEGYGEDADSVNGSSHGPSASTTKAPGGTTSRSAGEGHRDATTSPNLERTWDLLVAAASRFPGGMWIFAPVALGAAAALVLGLALGSARLAFFGVLFTFACVVLFYAFARGTAHLVELTGPIKVMVWGSTLLFILVLLTLYTCVFWGKPLHLEYWMHEGSAQAADQNQVPQGTLMGSAVAAANGRGLSTQRLTVTTPQYIQESSTDDVTKTWCGPPVPSGWTIDSSSVHFVADWSQGDANDHWSARATSTADPAVCYEVRTMHHRLGTSGMIHFHYVYDITKQ